MAVTTYTGSVRPSPRQLVAAALGTAGLWLLVAALAQRTPVNLTVVLLVLLVVVVGLALATGPILGALCGVAAVLLVNWYLVPPYGTLQVAGAENLAALVVFPLVAAASAALLEVGARARARAAAAGARAGLVGRVATEGTGSLEAVRAALALDEVRLVRGDAPGVAVAWDGMALEDGAPVVDVEGPDSYRLVGYGRPRIAEDPDFLRALAAATVRAYESGRLGAETRRADELSAVDEARTALLASVGHDLRTPLAGLRLAVDTLRSPDVELDDASRAALLDTVEASTTRLDELITNLLDMSRLEAGGLVAHLEPVALYGVVASAVAGRSGAVASVHVAEDLPLVLADPVLLERVVENLVSNAVRHGQARPGRPVEVRATPRTTAVVVDVVDRGPGLREGGSAAPLAPGGSGDASTGLGLSIVRAFCSAMSVPLELRPTEGGGLTARLTLPHARGVRP